MRHSYSVSVLLVLICVIYIQAFTPSTTVLLTRSSLSTTTTTRGVTPPSLYITSNRNTQLNLFKKLFKRNKNEKEETVTTSVLKDDKGNVIETTTTTKSNRFKETSLINEEEDNDNDDKVEEEKVQQEAPKEKKMFFARFVSPPKDEEKEQVKEKKEDPSIVNICSSAAAITKPEETPKEKAQKLKAQALNIKLEAEKMDIVLTLEKIDKLESDLQKVSKELTIVGNHKKDADEKKLKALLEKELEIQSQIKSLKKKLEGGDEDKVKKNSEPVVSSTATSVSASIDTKDLNEILSSVVSETKEKNKELSLEDLQLRVDTFNKAPVFMKDLVSKAAGMNATSTEFNSTQLMLQLYQEEVEFNTNTPTINEEPIPEFSQEQIDEVLDAVKLVPQFVKNLYGDEMKNNDTAIALMMLEEEWRAGNLVVMPEITQEMIDEKLKEVKWVPQFLRGDNDTALAVELIKGEFRRNPKKTMGSSKDVATDGSSVNGFSSLDSFSTNSTSSDTNNNNSGGSLFGLGDRVEKTDKEQMIESLFPESTRKEGNEINEGQAVLFMSEVLAKDNVWAAIGPPEKVPGGFLIRGSTRYETGAELIEAIDKNLEKSRVRNQIACFYVFDPTPVTEDQMNQGDRPPVLFVTAPDVARDPAPIQRSLISSVALGTIWYNSLLPFLLNDKYMKMADEQMALADASMPSNVDFLNDLSFPLFAATVGVQAIHELSHIIAANNNDLNITIPTLVPSLGTGLTGGITSLQNPPKDKQALFDFAIAGPLAGMGASFSLLVLGMVLSSNMDAAAFAELPALPLNLLRQSSLVGGTIDAMSPGLLTVPDAALGTKALSEMNIPLHPLSIAGYFGMMINAANLLPCGRTDGGRIALTLFGRSGTQLVSFLTFVFLFLQGLAGSDLLLFFFSFVVFFQSELEIPQRNEVDDMDFSRVLLATVTGVLVLLTLIPM